MSLERYCGEERTVVLRPNDSAYEAVRLLEHHHAGAVIVEDAGNVVGVASDRDLAFRVVGRELDARRTPLSDVMTSAPPMLTPDASERQAALLMRDRHVRRILIVRGGRAVGIVSLDDLLRSGAIDLAMAVDILDTEGAEAPSSDPTGVQHPGRARERR